MADQKKEFEEVAEQLTDLPVPLTPIRICDILCWTAEKWDVRGIHKASYVASHKSLLKPFKTEERARNTTENRYVTHAYHEGYKDPLQICSEYLPAHHIFQACASVAIMEILNAG